MLSTFTTVGSIGVLANHQPLLTLLDPTELRLHKAGGEVLRFAQGEGFLQTSGTHALVLVDEVFPIDQLDQCTVSDRLREAEERLERVRGGLRGAAPGRARQAPLRGVLQAGRGPLTEVRFRAPPPGYARR